LNKIKLVRGTHYPRYEINLSELENEGEYYISVYTSEFNGMALTKEQATKLLDALRKIVE